MSDLNTVLNERRLSLNGRNAYITVNAVKEHNNVNNNNLNKNYLTAKPIRASSLSPSLLNCEQNKAPINTNVVGLKSVNKQKNSMLTPTSLQTQFDLTYQQQPLVYSQSVLAAHTMPAAAVDKQKINTMETAGNNLDISKGALPKQSSVLFTPQTPIQTGLDKTLGDGIVSNPTVQTGIDRYFTVLKRKRSPKSSRTPQPSKQLREQSDVSTGNRFAILDSESNDPEPPGKAYKPPPIYLREQNSNQVIKNIITSIGENSFHVVPLKRGKIIETKIQTYSEISFRKLVSDFDKQRRNYYTYQLKSSKGLQVVIKGIDSCVDPSEVREALEKNGFKVKSVVNIRNRDKLPQPLFRVELEHGDIKLKKGEVHPIYNVKYLLYRKITIEEPHRRNGPVQCLNCQEFGHTKAYCKLPAVCVVCAELHCSSNCSQPRSEECSKKCSNCGENHTANYRGCVVYSSEKQMLVNKRRSAPVRSINSQNAPGFQQQPPKTNFP